MVCRTDVWIGLSPLQSNSPVLLGLTGLPAAAAVCVAEAEPIAEAGAADSSPAIVMAATKVSGLRAQIRLAKNRARIAPSDHVGEDAPPLDALWTLPGSVGRRTNARQEFP